MLAVTGYHTTIVWSLQQLLPDEVVERIPHDAGPNEIPPSDRYVLAAGVLYAKRITEQTREEIETSVRVNLTDTMRLCETVLDRNPSARICVIGSESGYKGSHDQAYAAAKAGLHQYVETRKVGKRQQLVAVAPHIIADSGMTRRRTDYEECMLRAEQTSRGRYITAIEVARLVHFLLYVDRGFVNNTVVRMHGGC